MNNCGDKRREDMVTETSDKLRIKVMVVSKKKKPSRMVGSGFKNSINAKVLQLSLTYCLADFGMIWCYPQVDMANY